MSRNSFLAFALSAVVLMAVISVALAANTNGVCSSKPGKYKGRVFNNHHINSSKSFLNQSAVATVHGCRHLCDAQPQGCIALSFIPPPATKDNCKLYDLTNIQKYLSPKPGHMAILLLPVECGEHSTVDGGWSSWERETVSGGCRKTTAREARRCDNPKPKCNGSPCIGDNERLVGPIPCTDLSMICNVTEEDIYRFNLSGKVFDALVTTSPNETASIVIQRRYNGSVDFFKMWDDFKRGFGNLSGEFWLGNDNIHLLTSQKNVSLKIKLNDGEETRFASYDAFEVASEEHTYRMSLGNYVDGDAGESFKYHDGMKFTTRDRDNDGAGNGHCATRFGITGGWWFKNCLKSNLNGKYARGPAGNRVGIIWETFRGFGFSLHESEMRIVVCG